MVFDALRVFHFSAFHVNFTKGSSVGVNVMLQSSTIIANMYS